MFEVGDGVLQDSYRARQLFRRACDGGNQEACTRLATPQP
jgi:TPR repeat protein